MFKINYKTLIPPLLKHPQGCQGCQNDREDPRFKNNCFWDLLTFRYFVLSVECQLLKSNLHWCHYFCFHVLCFVSGKCILCRSLTKCLNNFSLITFLDYLKVSKSRKQNTKFSHTPKNQWNFVHIFAFPQKWLNQKHKSSVFCLIALITNSNQKVFSFFVSTTF